jgi:ubiquinone/menaquinone biosynthesis C-methylase UbiE
MGDSGGVITNRELAERRERFSRRTREYLRLGHDRFEAARFVAGFGSDCLGPVLDVGTGKGIFAVELARRGLHVVTIDPDGSDQALAAMLSREAGLQRSIQFLRGDAAALPFPSGCFGCVAMMEVLHHLHDLPPAARELRRVLKPGGSLIVADFSDQGFDLVARVHRREGLEHHCSGITVEGAAVQLERHDLTCTGRHEGKLHRVAIFVRAQTPREAGDVH